MTLKKTNGGGMRVVMRMGEKMQKETKSQKRTQEKAKTEKSTNKA